MWVKANRTLSGMERVPREYYMVILECSYDAMKSRNWSECNFRWLCKRYTFPCWLLVTLIFCVIDPLPLAGRILLLAGSRCSWRNCKRTTEEKEKYHKSMWAKEKDIIGKHDGEKKKKADWTTSESTFGTAAWNIKSVKSLGVKFVKVAWTNVVCGFPGCFEKLNVILKELLSNATKGG